MSIVGKVESLWRYPVKAMRGEELEALFAGFGGVHGDRLFAFASSAHPEPRRFFTGRNMRQMILYRPRFRDPADAERRNSNLVVDVETPDGKIFAIDDPGLIEDFNARTDSKHELTLLRSDKSITDASPLSIFAVQTAKQVGAEIGMLIDKRRFRANVYIDLEGGEGFGENEFVGKSLRIGSNVVVKVVKRDTRCVMITLDPDTAEKSPAILKTVARAHNGTAGVYASVLVEGMIRKRDAIAVV